MIDRVIAIDIEAAPDKDVINEIAPCPPFRFEAHAKKLARPQLNDLAESVGIENPKGFKNIPALLDALMDVYDNHGGGSFESIVELEAQYENDYMLNFVDKAALHGAYGKIVAIGGVICSEAGPTLALAGEDERLMLQELNEFLDGEECMSIVSFCGSSYDLPMIRQRGAHVSVRACGSLWDAQNAKPWDHISHIDVYAVLSQYGKFKCGNLATVCHILGIPPDKEHDHKEVALAYEQKDWDWLSDVAVSGANSAAGIYEHLQRVGTLR